MNPPSNPPHHPAPTFRPFGGLALGLLLALACAGCSRSPETSPASSSAATPPAPGAAPVRLGYVLHGLNDFTQLIRQGAVDAAREEGAAVDVVGPAGFAATSEAIGMFEGLVQKQVAGLVVVPMPGEVWVTPIRQAVAAGIPVLTANVTSPGSAAKTWFGQDERASGTVLAAELRKSLTQRGLTSGRILVGICAPGVSVLVERYEGFKAGMQGSGFHVGNPVDVGTENTSNYGAWENLAASQSDTVALVGLCSMDLPNLAKLKARTRGTWIVAGYDLGRETLDAIRAGTIEFALGQHPYLQGYLPVAALARHLRTRQPLPEGWIDTGTEIVNRTNVDSIYGRETDDKERTRWYQDHITRRFGDLPGLARPLPPPGR